MSQILRFRYLWSVSALCALIGCSDDARDCSANADCASNLCRSNGSCAPVEGANVPWGGDGSNPADGEGFEAGGHDTSTNSDAAGSDTATADSKGGADADGAGGGGLCQPNSDGVIERHEVQVVVGATLRYRTAQDVSFDTAGDEVDGKRVWDFRPELAGDHTELVEARDVSELWFADEFPDATHAARLSDETDLLGIFQMTDDELLLLGIGSPKDALDATLITYDPPVAALRFPLEVGKSWTVEADVTGKVLGVALIPFTNAYTETYTYEVDARGTAHTPFGSFDVLRVRSKLVQSNDFGVALRSVRTFAFISECFSTVASVRSKDNESGVQFENAAEIRRLAP